MINPVGLNTKHLYNICTKLVHRRRRWADVVQMLYKCFVFAGNEICDGALSLSLHNQSIKSLFSDTQIYDCVIIIDYGYRLLLIYAVIVNVYLTYNYRPTSNHW